MNKPMPEVTSEEWVRGLAPPNEVAAPLFARFGKVAAEVSAAGLFPGEGGFGDKAGAGQKVGELL
jgi:hypothetical protein